MKPIKEMPHEAARAIKWVLTDIDDTMTKDGKLVSEAYAALCALKASGLAVIAVTGRSAGWGEVHLQEWPIDGVIIENGAVAYYIDSGVRKELVAPTAVPNTAVALRRAISESFVRVPRARPAGDNSLRRFDYAIDHAECVKPPLSPAEVAEIVRIFGREGCTAKPSSIHVNCWIGSFDKRAASVAFLEARCGYDDAVDRDKVLYVGDALNDEVMFAFFPNACAVANVDLWIDRMKSLPSWVSSGRYGAGFAEIAGYILAARSDG